MLRLPMPRFGDLVDHQGKCRLRCDWGCDRVSTDQGYCV